MATYIWKNGERYDADAVIVAFLNSKGRNKAEREALLEEYENGKDYSAWVEMIISKYGYTLNGETIEKVTQG